MCYFITIGVPEAKAAHLEEHIPRGLHIAPTSNRSILAAMGQGYRTYLLTSGGCSCALYSDSSKTIDQQIHMSTQAKQEQRRNKYKRLGWSKAKIERAMQQQITNHQNEVPGGLRGDVQQFLGELAMMIEELAVVVHWYDGDVECEQFKCKKGQVASVNVALDQQLQFTAEELIWIKTRKH